MVEHRSSEVRFLIGIQNFFFAPLSCHGEKHISPRTTLVGDHYLYSRDLYAWLMGAKESVDTSHSQRLKGYSKLLLFIVFEETVKCHCNVLYTCYNYTGGANRVQFGKRWGSFSARIYFSIEENLSVGRGVGPFAYDWAGKRGSLAYDRHCRDWWRDGGRGGREEGGRCLAIITFLS